MGVRPSKVGGYCICSLFLKWEYIYMDTHAYIYICNYSEYYDITPNKAPQNTEIHWAFDWVVWYMRGNGF